jgi:triacylglycerol lipase
MGQSAIAVIQGADPVDYLRFNKLYPQGMPTSECGKSGAAKVNGVQYWSWGGTGGLFFFQTNPLDLLDTAMYGITPLLFPKGVKHDGVVPLCGQYLGKPIRHTYAHNHTDAQRQLLGLVGITVNPLTLYRDQANRLKKAGL